MSHYIHLSVIGKSRTATFSLYFLCIQNKNYIYICILHTCVWYASTAKDDRNIGGIATDANGEREGERICLFVEKR